jgi:hypothetical protein
MRGRNGRRRRGGIGHKNLLCLTVKNKNKKNFGDPKKLSWTI